MSSNITVPTTGSVVSGTVKIILVSKDEQKKPFGTIVSLEGGAEGLLHVSEMKGGSFNARNQRLSTLKKGEAVTVEVIDVKDGGKRIGLSEKAIEERESLAQRDTILGALANGTEVTREVAVGKES